MLANNSVKPDQDRRTLTQLGDSLLSRGLLYSAQFCYVSAGVGFSRHPLAPLQPPATGSAAQPRLALLMGDARATKLAQLATNQAIFATEIYEYALSLNQDYVINELQVYKLMLATRLIDVGQYERALGYAEAAARAVTRDPRAYSPTLIQQLADLADRLKYHDPALQEDPPLVDEGGDSGEPSPRHHQQWLDDVKSVAQMLTAEASVSSQATPQHNYYAPPAQTAWGEQTQQQEYQPPQPQTFEPEETTDYSHYYQQQQPTPTVEPPPPPQDVPQSYEEWGRQEETTQQQGYDNTYWQGDGMYSYGEPAGDEPRPQITMPGTVTMPGAVKQRNVYGDYDDDTAHSPDNQNRDTQQATKTPPKKNDKAKQEAGGKNSSGWLGGILTKLSLRPPNQMILPDDKNPTIVWDPETKRWLNTDANEEETEQPPPPPPTLAHLAPQMQNAMSAASQQPPVAGAPPPAPGSAAPVSNIFKMQKGRHIKKSYVDVFNPSGAATRALPPAAEVLGPAPPDMQATPTYFIPQPTNTRQGGYQQETDDEQYRLQSGI